MSRSISALTRYSFIARSLHALSRRLRLAPRVEGAGSPPLSRAKLASPFRLPVSSSPRAALVHGRPFSERRAFRPDKSRANREGEPRGARGGRAGLQPSQNNASGASCLCAASPAACPRFPSAAPLTAMQTGSAPRAPASAIHRATPFPCNAGTRRRASWSAPARASHSRSSPAPNPSAPPPWQARCST